MSTELAKEFGANNGEDYGKVIEKWGKKLKGVKRISEESKKEWSTDLRKALSPHLVESLIKEISPQWKKVGTAPSSDTIKRFAQTAAKTSLDKDMNDLLERLRLMAQEPEPINASLTAANTVSEALKRVGQTVSQIFDMVVDKFNGIMERFFVGKGDLTGRRRWQTNSTPSRHSSLNGQVKSTGELFTFNGEAIFGPRPTGDFPASIWSNCSCTISYEKSNGDWVRIT